MIQGEMQDTLDATTEERLPPPAEAQRAGLRRLLDRIAAKLLEQHAAFVADLSAAPH